MLPHEAPLSAGCRVEPMRRCPCGLFSLNESPGRIAASSLQGLSHTLSQAGASCPQVVGTGNLHGTGGAWSAVFSWKTTWL